ncbi:murein hydrolase activator EnvC family protein [Paramaledivibacter caminithermalis]|jgi:murein DD-endopeptidase MepM/ murein hydrolase activator NlpD|uniref:Septal ring factor EnvC, activator of murein hydrolases AmiA and AmiB n=1 Tax=Paramaledivibacter caminithermalis (strain DSM 15212 / CIP 107654 / DViRD3) TaxID=1121301 RepID=A0A1M6KU55_PARC5|nr:M23 family metallopeptidase [Paramaledivibacter caminithermalis]SHJ62394.1 Septal ring factor EnvC, activator of murein hydrolases AmiA and AmiB [Paramaledivibacter caminithermalis DSM 15212]
MNRRKTLIFLISSVLMILMALEAFAFDINEDKKKLSNVNDKINKVGQEKKENEKKQKDITEKIKILEGSIIKLESEIEELNKNVVETKNKIELTKKELTKAQENIANKNDILNSRLEVMYKNRDVGYIEVLLDSTSFEDLLTRLDMVKKIFKHDVELLKYLKAQRDLIEKKKVTLENHNSQLIALMNSTKQKKESLKVSRGQMERVKQQLVQNHKALEKEEDKLIDLAKRIEDQIRRKQSSEKYVGGKMAWPAPGFSRITSPFGYRIHPILRVKKLHTGIDIGIPYGKNIVAAQSGKVIHSGWLGGYGKTIMIDHGGGIVTLYAHNSSILVKEGQKVERGQIISKCGSTGMSTGPHLHFEVRKNGEYIDPQQYVKKP